MTSLIQRWVYSLRLFALPGDVGGNHLDLGEIENGIVRLHVIAGRNVIDLVGDDEFGKLLGNGPVDELFGFGVVLATFDDARGFNAVAHAVFRIGNHDRITLLLDVQSVDNVEDARSALTGRNRHGAARAALRVHLNVGIELLLERKGFIFAHHLDERINTFGSCAGSSRVSHLQTVLIAGIEEISPLCRRLHAVLFEELGIR